MAKFNYRELYRSVASSEVARKRVNTIAENRFNAAKIEMINDFEQNEITQEIKNEGELFGFIGFDQGTDPTAPLQDVLEKETVFVSSKLGEASTNKVQYKFSLRIPTESIKKATPLPFEKGKSWAEGIEKGISGFGNFLRGIFKSPDPSHSGKGLQAQNQVRNEEFQRRDYLSKIFRDFVSKFR